MNAMHQNLLEIAPLAAEASALMSGFDAVELCVIPDDTVSDDFAALEDLPVISFADQLLLALATMAMRSKRRQADLCAALCRGRLDADPKRVTEALRQLERSGDIEHLVPLYDGGVLMSVTTRGIEKLSTGQRWNMLDGAGFLRA
jgi:hypothetical protein